MRVPILVGNWKMNLDRRSAVELARAVRDAAPQVNADIGLAPPFPYLSAVRDALSSSRVLLAAQNMHFEKSGAFTGEVSGAMLLDLGCRAVILGHSERRHVFGESNELVARKLRSALEQGLTPILCVGETLDERKSELTRSVVLGQVESAFQGLREGDLTGVILAYEPVWAIGTGLNATPAQAGDVHRMLRAWIAERFSTAFAETVRIQYGGSVKPENAAELLGVPDVDGALVGGGSLKADVFLAILEAASVKGSKQGGQR